MGLAALQAARRWTCQPLHSMSSRHRRSIELRSLMVTPARHVDRDTIAQATQQDPALERAPASAATNGRDPSSWQWILSLCTIAIFICYADRSNISVAILEMAKQFKWDEAYQGTILSAFFLGYAGTQLLGGTLADRYGGKTVLAAGVITWSLFTFLTPEAAAGGSITLISCRVAMGLGEVRLNLRRMRQTHLCMCLSELLSSETGCHHPAHCLTPETCASATAGPLCRASPSRLCTPSSPAQSRADSSRRAWQS